MSWSEDAALTRQQNTATTGHLHQPACRMSKILSLLIVVAMILHLIRPLGLPGLRKRSDFWKIAVAALAMLAVTVGLSHMRG